MSDTEADTCRKYVLPKLYGAGWTDDQINEQRTFTDGRVIPSPKTIRRGKQKRADYRFRFAPLPEQRRIVAYLDELQAKVDSLKTLQTQSAAELDALLPSILDKAFKREW
jgi:hypothetical protein